MKKVTLDKTTLTIDEKTSGYINITNGNGWYSVTRNNANVSVHPNGSTGYRVYGEKVWSSVLNIRDSAGKVVSVSVVVRENIKNLVVTWFNQSRSWVEWEIINFTTTSWNGNYTITSSNTNVASVSINSTLWNGSITLKTPGSTTITLKDGKAKSVSMNISVKQKYDVKLWVIYDVKSTSNKWVWWLQFKVSGNNLWIISEIWVQFTNSNWVIEKQSLKIQQDGIYMVAYSNDSCKWCSNFKPYYTIWWATNIANANDSWENEENEYIENEYVYEWENDEIEENQKEEWQVEIASATYWADFSWMIYILWFWKSLFSYKQKVVDIKDKYGEGASILISLIPLVWEWYDILTLLWMKDPITGEKLTKLDTWLTLAWLITWAWSWAWARKIWKEWLEKIAKELWMTSDEIIKIATDVISEYKFSTIDEFIVSADKLKLDNFLKVVKIKIEFTPLWRWHTWRYTPNNLNEKLALEQSISNAKNWKILNVTMTDSRWLGKDGWVKMSQNINWIEVHYVYNTKTRLIDDFKFKN